MSDKIESALTAEEWKERRVRFVGLPELVLHDDGDGMELVVYAGDCIWEKLKFNQAPAIDLPSLIALANAALPDSDPRKITREDVEVLRSAAEDLEHACEYGRWCRWCIDHSLGLANRVRLKRLADALESYLPPEPSE